MGKYTITNLDEFADGMRKIVFGAFGKSSDIIDETPAMVLAQLSKEEKEELETVLTHDEAIVIIKSLVKTQISKKTNKQRYIIDENIFNDIVEAINSRIVSNILRNLVQKGVVESAFDSDVGDFVFWISENNLDNDNDQTKKPKAS